MARFLSTEWFEQLDEDRALPSPTTPGPVSGPGDQKGVRLAGPELDSTGLAGPGLAVPELDSTDQAYSYAAAKSSPEQRGSRSGAPLAPIALEILVTDAPGGEVRYQIVVEGARVRARWRREELGAADVRFTTDYGTISGIAAGRLAAVDALAKGTARVSGNTALLARFSAAVDLVPAPVRASTTF